MTTNQSQSTQEKNKALVRSFVDEAQTRHNLDAVDRYLSENFVDQSPMPGIPPGRDGVKMLFSALYAAFPDLSATIHDQIAEGDKVVTRKTLSGTHRGELMGIPPTGKQVTFDVIDVLRVSNVKIAEHWAAMDQFGLMKQIGVFPAQS